MCFGQSPQAPKVVYQGPSEADLAANQAALDQYKSQMEQQRMAFEQSLQQQISAAKEETAALQKQYEADTAAATAAAATQQMGAYAASATQSTPPATAQTTAAAVKKEKPKANLKISTAALPSSSGAGLNIGV